MIRFALHIFIAQITLLIPLLTGQASAQSDDHGTVKVFILAGQSNMQGHGVVDLDDEKDYNGGKGTLVQLLENRRTARHFNHLRDAEGNWVERDDVFVRYQTRHGLKHGPLSIGFSGHDGKHHFGPELQFGHVVGDAFDEPVLLIKTAWGGKSLGKDFLPPSAVSRDSAEVGPFFNQMMDEIKIGMDNAATDFPQLADKQLEIVGFAWQQGWNDMVNEEFRADYETNLVCLINDVREKLNKPNLPFVIGELGNGGVKANEKMLAIRNAERAVARRSEFVGNVAFAPTARHARPAGNSPNVGHGHHWFGNAESYFLVGDSLGKAMVGLIDSRPRVLILGDSISIGYTPLVKTQLEDSVYVTRPNENCSGTTKGVQAINGWLELEGGNWDLIHFNFGLHDLKRVQPGTTKNSNDPNHDNQAPPAVYEKQLREIVAALKQTGAKLVFATTTPVPEGGVKPHRDLDAPSKYNEIAKRVVQENDIGINDLFAVADPVQSEIMRPVNVHFLPEGSKLLAGQVAKKIRDDLGVKE